MLILVSPILDSIRIHSNMHMFLCQARNRLQDILTDQFKTGRTGNAMLLSALKQAKKEGIKPQIYTHPNGDYPLYPNTAYAIELNAKVFIPSWNKEIAIMLEEDAFFDGKNCEYIDPRQTKMIEIDWEK